ncbi:major tail protein [Mycobacterium phage Aminay]|uniref:Major tail protein n=1 Tax=Mycobacterium phage Aminay TaxID=2250291 RepID=A0A345KV02_9CAUD|nr:major tail protein [Mycobacterium phage Aminay]AXH46854.1 major tail protein [Mycobacterium phage Aminay]
MTAPDPAGWGDASKLFAASPSDLVTVGGLWYAPFGTPLPEDVDEPLDAAFKNLGYISVDGVTVKIDDSTKPIEVWGGDEIGELRDKFSIEYSMGLFQVLSPEVNAAIFGTSNVSTSVATVDQGNRMKVLINSKLPKRCSLVLDSVYEDKMIRQVAQIAQRSGIGDIKLVHNEPMTFEPTFKVLKGTDGNHVIQYSDDGVIGV